MSERLQGVFAAVLTPFDDTLAPDAAGLIRHCRWLLRHGCDGLAVLGTTGEANSLTVDERVGLIEALAGADIPGRALLPGTGCCAIPDTVQLTRTALAAGAAGVLMLPPFYYKSVTADGLFAAFAETIEGVGDDRLRVFLYHFPQMSGVPIPITVIERLRARYGAVIAGVKDSSGDFANMQAMLAAIPELAVFTGADELLLPLLESGGAGCITGLSNITSPLAADVFAAWRRGDHARAARLQARLTALRQAVLAYPLTAALKAILSDHTGEPVWNTVRPPLSAVDAAGLAALVSALDRLGYAPAAIA
jgi:4-hydroxy-tetrahydrodipicolinate synthase